VTRRSWFRLAAAAASFPLTAQDVLKKGVSILSVRPEDYEMPFEGFLSYLTPLEQFFVRSHHYTPRVEVVAWQLDVSGLVNKPTTFTFDDLKKLPHVETVSVLECAGNGRGFYEPSMPGLQWKHGGVGNAKWTGVRLADVLKAAGGTKTGAIEVLFDGEDIPVGKQPEFARSIPIAKALSPETLLAYEMNGQPLPYKHGYPLRVVVPGWAGDSWVKWLKRIEVRDTEFDGFYMKTAYRHPGVPVRPGTPVDPAKMSPVTNLRVKSVIATPVNGAILEPGKPVPIKGVAWSDGSAVTAVDVSTDGGRTWKPASFGSENDRYGWRMWSINWTPPREGWHNLMARARTAQDIQPLAQEWNPSGYSWNVVHNVGVNVGGTAPPNTLSTSADPGLPAAPEGYGAACLRCHGEEVMGQQRLTEAQWNAEVEKMVRWGAAIRPSEKSAILEYLIKRYPYRPLK
jgi:DMSO/TMAO reductase YedYZ molybdopterin-dependent catalytic subunit